MGKIIQNYSLQHQLGSGVYSKVYKAINLKNKQQVAIKMVKAEKFKQLPKLEEGTVNQINILSNLEPCPHIIKYYDMLKTVNNFYFVYQFCNGGTLQSLLKKQGPLPQKNALIYFSQIVDAFRVLNKNNIMHRDLKPDNILLHDGVLKIADFGFCKPLQNQQDTTQTMLGSPIYMAPQILKGQVYTIKADIWSLGVVLFRMIYGYCPFQSNNIGKLIMIIEQEQMKIPEKPQVSFKVSQLLKKMLTKNPNLRADWSQIFSYQIINGQLMNSGISQKKNFKTLTDSGLKNSLTPTIESSSVSRMQYGQTISFSSKDFGKGKPQQRIQKSQYSGSSGSGVENGSKVQYKKDFLLNLKDNQMRNTYTTKSPLRQNLKRDMMLKNHNKCVQMTSLIVNLCKYQCLESFLLGYLFSVNVQKELNIIMQSIKKEGDIRALDEVFMRSFYEIVDNELGQIRMNIQMFVQQIRSYPEVRIELVESKRRQYLKKFINSLRFQNINQLVMASRILDFMEDSLVIRKQTYQKMSKGQLTEKIKDKLQTITDI